MNNLNRIVLCLLFQTHNSFPFFLILHQIDDQDRWMETDIGIALAPKCQTSECIFESWTEETRDKEPLVRSFYSFVWLLTCWWFWRTERMSERQATIRLPSNMVEPCNCPKILNNGRYNPWWVCLNGIDAHELYFFVIVIKWSPSRIPCSAC